MNKPNLTFLGIGAAKSGTTWLTECLMEHPQIFIPFQKELCFFDWVAKDSNFNKGISWYNNYFKDAPETSIKGEFSTHYMYFEESHRLIKETYPNIKILVCLRKPEELAYSLYWWRKANYESSSIPDTFEDAIEKDPQYIERGLYYKQLKRYYDNFPKENIKIILFDEIRNNPKKVINDVCLFLGVSTDFSPKFLNKKINHAKRVRFKFIARAINSTFNFLKKVGLSRQIRTLSSSTFLSNVYTRFNKQQFTYPKMKQQTEERLHKIFKSDIEQLEKLITFDLSLWK